MVGVMETEMVVVEGRERQTETPVDRVIRLGLPQGTITSDAQAYSSRL